MPNLNEEQIATNLQDLDTAWTAVADSVLNRVFKFKDFNEALSFVNDVAKIADQLNHHPDIELTYGKVEINLTTHSTGGLTEKDFDFAKKIDQQKV